MGGPFFLQIVFPHCKQMWNTGPFAKYKCSYQKTWWHKDAALVCCCPSFYVWGDLSVHSVITEAQCVTNEKFNETLSMDQQPGPRPQTDYEISYFPSQHGVFFIIAQYAYGILYYPEHHSWATEQRQHNSGCCPKETLQMNDMEYRYSCGPYYTVCYLF